MKNMIKDALILFAITLVAGLLLGAVNEVTKEPIAIAKENAKNAAYREVFPTADKFVLIDVDENVAGGGVTESGFRAVEIDEVLEAYVSGDVAGYVITVTEHEGYGGDIQMSLGISKEGILNGVSILSISETAGLGMKAGTVLVPQFANKNIHEIYDSTVGFIYTKNGATEINEIDAISGATITTSAFTRGVDFGVNYYNMVLKEDK